MYIVYYSVLFAVISDVTESDNQTCVAYLDNTYSASGQCIMPIHVHSARSTCTFTCSYRHNQPWLHTSSDCTCAV